MICDHTVFFLFEKSC